MEVSRLDKWFHKSWNKIKIITITTVNIKKNQNGNRHQLGRIYIQTNRRS